MEQFTEMILDAATRHIPRTSGTPRRAPVPWWTDECRAALRARRRAFRRFDRNATTENMIAFKRARAKARHVILNAKRASWREYVGRLNRFTPVTTVWTQIKRIAGACSPSPMPVLRVRGQSIMQPFEVANEIAEAFAGKCSDTGADPLFLLHKRRQEARTVDFFTTDQLSYNQPFTLVELRSAISSLRKVSEGPDKIHNEMLRHLPDAAVEALLGAFNRLWEGGEFPRSWRDATVIPILKPGKSGDDPLHYRPISLTSALCKLLEKLVNFRLSWFLEHNDILTEAQCGFRRH